jgi:ADP-dependent NAD(P)H-hydrate dehydratase
MTATPLTPHAFNSIFAIRSPQSHKGTFGSVGILGGAQGLTGAAVLAARAALKTGAGRVYVGLAQPDPQNSLDVTQPELMWRSCHALISMAPDINAWALGCGLGESAFALNALRQIFQHRGNAPIVVDADALNALSSGQITPVWGRAPVVITPHPTEAARLLKCDTETVQSDRVAHAQALAKMYKAWVVLKGHQTIICAPNLNCWQNTTGNAGLATAGTGDVLSGMIASLIAQGFSVEESVLGGVWLHGKAADYCVAQGVGPIGLTASEVIDAARWVRNHPETH